jgi:regulator of protease activity HflC (stomatin/prohibitin superfamily)
MAANWKAISIPTLIVVGVGLLIILILIISSAKKLNSYELGIKYDHLAKRLSNTVNGEGLHFGVPGFTFIIFPSVYKTMEFRDISVSLSFTITNEMNLFINFLIYFIKCLNKDGVIIDVDVSYQFKAK